MSKDKVTLDVAEKTVVYTIGGRIHTLYEGDKDKRPATATDALVGTRVRTFVPASFPATTQA